MKKTKLPKLVEIEWIDSSTGAGWISTEDINVEPVQCVTVGFIIRETKTAVMVAASLGIWSGVVDQACDPITIPKVAITKRRNLKRGR